ncbi:Ferric reductase like transmembrane component [Desulfosporosinus orientis DSM 765]|uniref:Ferric reductase like transmembrane component n=1 Tax=Desulfosporosinus orientis (strain ATCC 19365 / DSM 765 / NCIMB 8382 / VKM B-1628 / Singapore I) TaxID=768706 RepID=G7W6L5_DESOD|nr:ferric reductase-like transmembrane domain-containing protein [Desulfosporosinus orientis]AET68653.1 Ferric reductase like transmembrane component [Desulfosporosinus orientis DSM 765]
MSELSRFLQHSYQKIIYFACLSSIVLVFNFNYFAKQAGGIACFIIALLLILSVIKTLFLEIIKNPETRSKTKRIFEICHRGLGWIMYMLIIYHSFFYIFLWFQGVDNFSVSYIITGLIATVIMIIVLLTGLDTNVTLRSLNIKRKSVYFSHILMTIILALLIVTHINFG